MQVFFIKTGYTEGTLKALFPFGLSVTLLFSGKVAICHISNVPLGEFLYLCDLPCKQKKNILEEEHYLNFTDLL